MTVSADVFAEGMIRVEAQPPSDAHASEGHITFVDNAVHANLLACEAPNVAGKVFNVGTGARISLNEVLATLRKITSKALEAKYDPPREGDIRDSQADISQARKFLGYEPQVGFEQGLQITFEWYRGTQAKGAAKSEK